MQLQGRRRPQASITNSPSSYFETSTRSCRLGRLVARMQTPGSPRATWRGQYRTARGSISHERSHGEGDHPIPFRTRQLSPSSPKVLRFRPREDRALRSWGMLSLFLHPGGAPRGAPFLFCGAYRPGTGRLPSPPFLAALGRFFAIKGKWGRILPAYNIHLRE